MADLAQLKSYYEGKVEPIYRTISGISLHLAMVDREGESHTEGTLRTKKFLAKRLDLAPGDLLVDLASGYGDASLWLSGHFGCRVVALNLIHVQNKIALENANKAENNERLRVIEGDFNHVPIRSGVADVVWTQESLLHAEDRGRVLREAARILQPGGILLLTDILQLDVMEAEEQRLIYERVSLKSLESFESYRELIAGVGLQMLEVVDLSRHTGPYYADLATNLEHHRETLVAAIGSEYVEYTIGAMRHWSEAAYEGKLGWGMVLSRKV